MHPQYAETLERIRTWCKRESNIAGAVIIGSQARRELTADNWSDLDLMLFVHDVAPLLNTRDWLDPFGHAVCIFNETVPLPYDWDWHVRRVLYDDYRDIDFSLLPYACLNEVLLVNREIMAKGYGVIYDSAEGELASQIQASIDAMGDTPPFSLTPQDFDNTLNDLLFHIIWAFKKIKRNELWVAVRCINFYIGSLLLRLVEWHNATVSCTSSHISYDGRFLEARTDEAIRERLRYCVTKYDAQDAVDTLGHLLDTAQFLAEQIAEHNGYTWDAGQFEQVNNMYQDMKD